MAIIINIDVILAKRKMSVTELSERAGISMDNISIMMVKPKRSFFNTKSDMKDFGLSAR